jgi:pimeloyl-ACP methyl ester carboxylesterase
MEAPAIFLIAGLGMQLIEWPDALIETLSRRFRVIRLDNRDSGRSGRLGGPFAQIPSGFSWSGSRPGTALYDLDDMARDVLALADHLGIARFACAGFSMGGMIAQKLAVLAPERIERMVSLSSTGGTATLSADAPSFRMMERFFLPFPSERDAIQAYQDSNSHFSLGAMQRDSRENLDLARTLAKRAPDHGGFLRQALAITSTPPWGQKVVVKTVPALFLHGENDPCIDMAAARDLASAMPRAGFKSFAGLGHWIDDRVCQACSDWLTASQAAV